MLTEKEIKDFKEHGFTDKEIERLNESLKSIKTGKVHTKEEVKKYIDDKLFAEYKTHV